MPLTTATPLTLAEGSSATATSRIPTEHVDLGRLSWAGPLTTLATATISMLIRAIGVDVGAIPEAYQNLLPPMVIGASAVASLGATILLAILSRTVHRPIRTFQIIAGVFLVVSFGAPIQAGMGTMQGGTAGWSTVATMIVMHIVAAAVIVGLLSALGRRRVASLPIA